MNIPSVIAHENDPRYSKRGDINSFREGLNYSFFSQLFLYKTFSSVKSKLPFPYIKTETFNYLFSRVRVWSHPSQMLVLLIYSFF